MTVTSLAGWQYWRVSLRTIEDDLTEAASNLADRITVVNGLLEITGDTMDAYDRAIEDINRYQAIYSADGQLLYGTSTLIPEQLASSRPVQTRAGYREVHLIGPNASIVVAGQSLDATVADLRRLAFSLSLASLLGALLTMPVAIWLRRQLARSIGQIDETARSLAPGQDRRVDLSRVADEFVGVASALNSAFDRLDDAVARERQLTSDASHELRTPATTLLAEARWALDRPRTADEYKGSLEVCARQGARMKDLVESLLTLARLEAGAIPPARARLDLRDIVDDTAAEFQAMAAQHQVAVRIDGSAEVWADGVQIRILVSNLLSNAIRYNHVGGSVTVRIQSEPGRGVLAVSDTGPGLAPAVAARVFERFWRATSARSTRDGGTGLGLAISKAIVTAHGGEISVESEPGQGTTFLVWLPAGEPTATPPLDRPIDPSVRSTQGKAAAPALVRIASPDGAQMMNRSTSGRSDSKSK